MTIVTARLTPAHEDVTFFEIADGKRPDDALALARAVGAVHDRELAFVADGVAKVREVLRRKLSKFRGTDAQRHDAGAR